MSERMTTENQIPATLAEEIEIMVAVGGLSPAQKSTFKRAAERIEELEAKVDRTCEWRKQTLSMCYEYDSWGTSCGEDYAICEEWDETPPNFCGKCGGKVVDVTSPRENDDE